MEVEIYKEDRVSHKVPIIIMSVVMALMVILTFVGVGLEIDRTTHLKQTNARVMDIDEYYVDTETDNNGDPVKYQKIFLMYIIDGQPYNTNLNIKDGDYVLDEQVTMAYDDRCPEKVYLSSTSYAILIVIGLFLGIGAGVALLFSITDVRREKKSIKTPPYDLKTLMNTGEKVLGQVGIVNKKYDDRDNKTVVAIQAICFQLESNGEQNVDADYFSDWIKPLGININNYYVDIYVDKQDRYVGYVDLHSLREQK